MDIKEIAEQVSKRIYVEDGLLLSKFISEKFAEALIESYKAELLKEVGEPVAHMYPDKDGPLAEKCFIGGAQTGDIDLYTSDQLAAAILKATKPLEEEVERLSNQNTDFNELDKKLETEAGMDLTSMPNAINELRAQLAKAEQLWQLAQGRCDALEEKLAKAEQRVADVCGNCGGTGSRIECNGEKIPCDLCEDDTNSIRLVIENAVIEHCNGADLWMATMFAARKIRSGEWRKFVKEV